MGGALQLRAQTLHGSPGFADPKAGIGYTYVTSQMGTTLTAAPRDVSLRNAIYSIV